MNELDDRLAGDLVWELFPDRSVTSAPVSRRLRAGLWLAVACVVAVTWFVSPDLAVAMACLAISAGDFRKGWQLARSIPDKAGGTICSWFTYGWGAWKLAMLALAFMFATAFLGIRPNQPQAPPALVASLLLAMCGQVLSAVFTAAGLFRAYRSGMRVWVGAGVNQARLLLLGMLLVGFTLAVIGPFGVWLAASNPRASNDSGVAAASVLVVAFFGLTLVGPIVLLNILDWLSHRVVADHPGKFGPKVAAVGKWN